MKNCAIFSCLGLGDGLITLVLSNNLKLNGISSTTFHPFLSGLQSWFPDLPLMPFPALNRLKEELDSYDHFFIFYEKSPWMRSVLDYCLKEHPKATTVLNPIATCNRDYPFWEGGRFNGGRSFVDNLVRFCQETLLLKLTTKHNGITLPGDITAKKYSKRVILHPMSSKKEKNWPKEKFLKLAKALADLGYQPVFALMPKEVVEWDLREIDAFVFESQNALARFVSQSSYLIGNDSGIGHLASCLKLSTLTICRNHQVAKFWRPGWSQAAIVSPYCWIPNLKGARLRDRHWKKWISVERVLKNFLRLTRS